MASTFKPPRDAGRRLLPTLIDELARTHPERAFSSIPLSLDPRDGYRDVNYREFANAINRCAWWIQHEIGRGRNFETIAYMGPTDIRYAIICIAAIKTGYTIFFSSPRNSVEGHLSLLDETQCRIFLVTRTMPPLLSAVLSKRPMRTVTVPEVEDLLSDDRVPHFPFNKLFDEARYEPILALHTSGSTGTPKVVVTTHGSLAALDAYQLIPALGAPPTHYDAIRGTRAFLALPPFHAAGIALLLATNVFFETTIVLPPPVPLNAEIVDLMHTHGDVTGSILPSSILADIAKTPSYIRNLRRLEYVGFGGAPLPKHAGDIVRTVTKAYNIIGSTETHNLPTQLVDQEDWDYMSYSPYLGYEYRYHAEDLYELVIARDRKLDLFQGVFCTFPNLEEYPMKDLYSEHPTKPGLWLYRGRADDVIVFVNGEKLNPLSMENIIASHPETNACLVIGQGKFEAGLLVEPKHVPISSVDRAELLNSIWPYVQRANQETVAHGRISKSLIMFTSPDKPMSRAGKGSIQRKTTVDSYKEEIEALYAAAESRTQLEGSLNLDMRDKASLCSSLHRLITHNTGLEFSDSNTNLFSLGLDSLQVIQLVRQINAVLGRQDLKPKTLYSNPTLERLATVLWSSRTGAEDDVSQIDQAGDRVQKMQKIFRQYSADLPITVRPASPTAEAGLTVLLTGSSGSLGSYIFHALLAEPTVRKIYCLSRVDDAEQRQKKLQSSRGLTASWDPKRVVFKRCDLSQPYLGLPHGAYMDLLRDVTHILHNAWEVDFNRSIDSFASNHVYGVRQFIDFSARSAKGAFIFLISTVGTVMQWGKHHSGVVPEQIIDDWTVPQPMGYAESKYVAERLLDEANRVAGVPSAICRVGQVSGPTTKKGVWREQEWLPSLVASSKYLGKVPASLGPMEVVDWIPVDILARIITELLLGARNDEQERASSERVNGNGEPANGEQHPMNQKSLDSSKPISTRVYHAVNPSTTTWSKLLPAVLQNIGVSLEIVSFNDWVDTLRESSLKPEDIAQNPALKLLDFFEGLQQQHSVGQLAPALDTARTVWRSEMLAKLGPVSAEWMANWIRQWGF